MVTMGGIITQRRTQLTKNGERMAFLTLEDLYGTFEVIVFPETYRQSVTWCESDAPILVWGKTESDASEGRVLAQRLLPLESDETWRGFRRLTLLVSPQLGRNVLLQVRDLLAASPGDSNVVLAVPFADGERVVMRASERLNVMPSHALLDALDQLLGAGNVRVG